MRLKIVKRGQYYALLVAEGNGWRSVGMWKTRDGAYDALLAAKQFRVS